MFDIVIRPMRLDDYEAVYALWLSCKGMGLNDMDDSREGLVAILDAIRLPASLRCAMGRLQA